MQNITIAMKRIENIFEAALVVNGKFTRAITGINADIVLDRLLGPILMRYKWEDGAEVVVTVNIEQPAAEPGQEAGA